MSPDHPHLAEVLTEFARTMVTDCPIEVMLDRLVERVVQMLPVTAAGVTLVSAVAEPRYVGASDDIALRYENLQLELAEGPCLLAHFSGCAVSVPDLRSENRFPTFAQRAAASGMLAVHSFPLRHGENRLGALDLYCRTAGLISRDAMTTAQVLADVVSVYLVNAQARRDLQESSDRSRQAALHDPLTGLPNRVLLLERLEHGFMRSRRTGRASALFFIDLDEFKSVNDLHGHRVGDELLIAVAARLSGLLRPHDTLARLAGDEFVVLCEDLNSPEQVPAIGARITIGLARPFPLSDATVELTGSVGSVYAADADRSPEQLLHDADSAMYRAKELGGDRHHAFDTRVPHAFHRTSLESDLHRALDRGEFRNRYQPIVATRGKSVVGLETEVHWQHSTLGVVPPMTLIPLAEQTKLIALIGQWALGQAWADLQTWRMVERAVPLGISVRITSFQLMSAGFTSAVSDVVTASGVDPGLLTLEVTEDALTGDRDRALLVLGDLKSHGVRIAIDGFGSGDSSLSHLQRYPIDTVKLDRSLVAVLEHDRISSAIAGAIVGLAHKMGITVVASGVETLGQLNAIAELGCDHYQGILFAGPMSAGAVADLLNTPA